MDLVPCKKYEFTFANPAEYPEQFGLLPAASTDLMLHACDTHHCTLCDLLQGPQSFIGLSAAFVDLMPCVQRES